MSTRRKSVLIALIFVAACTHTAGVTWPFNGFTAAASGTWAGLLPARGDSVWWLQAGALAVCFCTLRDAPTAGQAFLRVWGFATVWLSCTFWWLFIAMHTYGGLAAPLACAAVVLLAGALGLYYGAACALWHRYAPRTGWISAAALASGWTLAELARSQWLTGFGWGAIGYAHTSGPLHTLAPYVGVFGITWAAAWFAAALAQGRDHWRGLVACSLVLGVACSAGAYHGLWTHPQGSLSITLLQGNIPQDEKFEPGSGIPEALAWYSQQLLHSTSRLTVAPETAIPLLPQQLPDGYLTTLARHFDSNPQAALIGIPLGSYEKGYTNSVIGLQAGQTEPWRYDKHHLVPFGEFIPTLFKWFTRLMNIPLGDFNRGAVGQTSYLVDGQRLAAQICYEDLFGEELAARFIDPALAPTMFINVSNIGWFDDSIAQPQHLNIARMRSLEFQIPTARATNTGATVLMDAQGRVQRALPPLTRGVLEGTLEGRAGITPYAWWAARWGSWPVWLACLCLAGLGFKQRRTPICNPSRNDPSGSATLPPFPH